MGVISEEQLEQALTVQKESAEPLGTVLVACGCASRLAIQDALARQSGFSFEPEHGYGTGLRTKLVEGERRPEPPTASQIASLHLAPNLDLQPEPRAPAPAQRPDHPARRGAEFERLCAELRGREQRLEQLERALETALRERAELEARFREHERRLDELESELDAARTDPTGPATPKISPPRPRTSAPTTSQPWSNEQRTTWSIDERSSGREKNSSSPTPTRVQAQ
jgi:hypothetical protein